MRRSLVLIATMALVTAFWAAPAAAEGYGTIDVNVPFQFVAVNTTLPAGHYVLQRSEAEDPAVWTLTNAKGNVHVELFAKDAPEPVPAQQTEVVFDQLGGENFLSQIWIGGDDPGRQIEEGHAEERLLADGSMKPTRKAVQASTRHMGMSKSS